MRLRTEALAAPAPRREYLSAESATKLITAAVGAYLIRVEPKERREVLVSSYRAAVDAFNLRLEPGQKKGEVNA